jgi:segregation and condensation protein A
MGETGKPFYLQPPWDILFNIQRLQKINPWNINIAFLLLSFLEEMERRANIDFRASGIALDSSAFIYLLKSNLLLKLEKPPSTPPKSTVDFIPPPLIPPLRYELTTTTLQNLLEALDEALRSEKMLSLKAPQKPILPPSEIIPTISAYLMEIEDRIKDLLSKMRLLAERGEIITFSKLVNGLDKIEMIRIFIILLFMAQRGKVTLWQHEEFGEIYITLNSNSGGTLNVSGES